jgi:hypothetical protein
MVEKSAERQPGVWGPTAPRRERRAFPSRGSRLPAHTARPHLAYWSG